MANIDYAAGEKRRDVWLAIALLPVGIALSGFCAWVCFVIFTARQPGESGPIGYFFGFFLALAMAAGFLEVLVKIALASLTTKRFETLLSRGLWYWILVVSVALLVSAGIGALEVGNVMAVVLVAAMLGGFAFTVTKANAVVRASSLPTLVSSMGVGRKPAKVGPLPPIPAWFRRETTRVDGARRYVPNQIDLGTRIVHTVSSLLLLTYGALGLFADDLYVPGKRGPGVHLHGVAALTMFFAMLCACVVMSSTVVDHYDRRDNERLYRRIAKYAEFAGWTLMVVSMLLAPGRR